LTRTVDFSAPRFRTSFAYGREKVTHGRSTRPGFLLGKQLVPPELSLERVPGPPVARGHRMCAFGKLCGRIRQPCEPQASHKGPLPKKLELGMRDLT
jgi:hypothetical protein